MTSAAIAGALVLVVGWHFALWPSPRGMVEPAMTHRWGRRATALVVVGAALGVGIFAATITLLAAALAPRLLAVRQDIRRRRSIERVYPDAIEMVVLAIRSGELPAAALQSICPYLPSTIAPAFQGVQLRVDAGERFADALSVLTESLGQQAQPLVDSLAAADRYGLPLAPVLDRLAFEARQHRRRAADSRARQLPVRLSAPLVLCTLPSFVFLAIVPLLLGAISSLSL